MAPGLKSLEDALKIRHRFLSAFEEAEKAAPEERESWLRFVVVGGGPTGVELAGILPDIAHHSMLDDFRNFDPRDTKIVLLEGGPRLLTAFEPDLAARALRDLAGARRGGAPQRGRHVHRGRTPCSSASSGFRRARCCGPPATRPRRSRARSARRSTARDACSCNPDLSVPGAPHIFVAGDLAAVPYKNGISSCPPSRRRRIRWAKLAAKNIRRLVADLPTLPFKYRDKGNLATIGRYRAIAEIGKFKLRGQIRVVVLADHPPHVSRDVPQSHHRADRVGVLVSDVSARVAAAHGARGRWGVGGEGEGGARGGVRPLILRGASPRTADVAQRRRKASIKDPRKTRTTPWPCLLEPR